VGRSANTSAAAEATNPRLVAQQHVRHFLADFSALEARWPDTYPRMIVRGEGPYLYDDAGRQLLDCGNHLGAGMIGHGRREVGQAMAEQAERLEFAALDSGVSHDRVAELADRLRGIVPLHDPVFAFTSSGSEANELAFKIARAYHAARGEPDRVNVLSRDGSYHGSTYAGMAATGSELFRGNFGPLPPGFERVPLGETPDPSRPACSLAAADELEAAIARHGAGTIAAVVAEPVAILGAVKVPEDGYWERVQAICHDAGALLILDEVVTGFGRTGRMFGSEHWDVRPDVMTLAKGLTSGYAPMGATVVTREVEDAFRAGPLLHLNTWAGHPVVCAAALAVLDVLEREQLPEHAAELEPLLAAGLERVGAVTGRLERVSTIGLLSSIELDLRDREDGPDVLLGLRHALYERGVIARCGYGDGVLSVVFYPTLIVDEQQLDFGTEALALAIADALGEEQA
jgi:adenosylmethionine-8-amino-7-oxononanoate aminotransferase